MTDLPSTPTRPSVYRRGEALHGQMTALEFLNRSSPGLFELIPDTKEGLASLTQEAHDEAARLGLDHSPSGMYAPIVWELAWVRRM